MPNEAISLLIRGLLRREERGSVNDTKSLSIIDVR